MPRLDDISTWHMPISNDVQTRSETTGLVQHPSLMNAIEAAIKDKTIWKISYSHRFGPGRFVRSESDSNYFHST